MENGDGNGFDADGSGVFAGITAKEPGQLDIKVLGEWFQARVGCTQEGEGLCDKLERIRHCARSDRLAAGRKPTVANVASEYLEPRDWIG